MLKVTIDTNVIINEEARGLLAQIEQLAEQGLVDIAFATRVIADKNQDANEGRKAEHLKEFGRYPKVGTVFRLGVSTLGNGDFLAGDEHVQVSQQIEEVLFGKIRANDKRANNKWADVDHLVSHYFAKRDVFITQDKRIQKKKDILREQLGIAVETPQEFLCRFPECK